MNAEIQWTCAELIGALVEGGAQGALITALIWGALKLCPGVNAATRHAAWFATLIIVALLPVAHFGEALAERLTPVADAAIVNQSSIALPSPAAMEASDDDDGPTEIPADLRAAQSSTSPENALASAALSEPAAPIHKFEWRLAVPAKISVILVGTWLALAAIRLAGIVGQLRTLREIKKRAFRATDSFVYAFGTVVAGMGISRKPRLLISEHAGAPMVVGFFNPAMLLPKIVAERSTSSQLEHLFRHELAHLARGDDWTNLAQQIVAAVLFFHPGVLFLSRRLTAEREIACDDHALAAGRAPREYALFLTEFASQMKGRDFTAAPAAWSSNSQLKERIGMILNGKRNASPRASRVGVGAVTATAVALGLAAMIATPRFVVAAEDSAPKALAEVSVKTSSAPAVEIAVDAEPAEVAEPAIQSAPPAPPRASRSSSSVTIASITTPPREKDAITTENLNIDVRPRVMRTEKTVSVHPKIAMTAQADVDADSQPHPKPSPRWERDGDLEKRLARLEKLVQELSDRQKHGSRSSDAFGFQNDFNPNELRSQLERAQKEAEHARRDAERAMREQKVAMETQMTAQRGQLTQLDRANAGQESGRDALKARRHALESQRKQIEKELESIDRQMQKDDQAREKRKGEDKLERKTRDKGDNDSDDSGKPK